MSTHVEKGGTKFRPLFKARARPSATPGPTDARARPSAEPSVSMPPPSIIPEPTPSVVPTIVAPSNPIVPAVHSSVPQVHSSKPQAIETPVVLPSLGGAAVQPTFTKPDSVAERASMRPVVSIASTSSIAGPSSGMPITLSRSTPALSSMPSSSFTPASVATPSSSKGKKRVVPQAGEEGTGDDRREQNVSSDARGGVARKRPKLSIVQADEDRVKRPVRTAKTKKKVSISNAETRPTGRDEEIAISAEVPNMRVLKKAVNENTGGDMTLKPSRSKNARTKRKKAQGDVAEDTDAVAVPQDPEFEPEISIPARNKSKKRRRAETIDPEAILEPIDPTQVTMSAICDDPGSGRMSSRWETSQTHYIEARKRAREEQARAIAEAAEEERETGRVGARKGASRPTLPTDGKEGEAGEETIIENANEDPDEFTYKESLKASHYAPQVRIGANGEVVLDMESLQVDRAAEAEIPEDAYSFVEESDQTKFTNSNSWSKRRTVRWSKEDTAMFYDALRQFGQNFDLIARVLPGRTYRMCRNKFKAEDRKNPRLIDDALTNSVAVDINTLSRMTGKDFSGPTPVIRAKRALDLGDNDALAEPAAPDGVEARASENKTSRTEGDQTRDVQAQETRQLSSTLTVSHDAFNNTLRGSYSPPPPESLLNAIPLSRSIGSPGIKPSGPVVISTLARGVTHVNVSEPARQPRTNEATASMSQQPTNLKPLEARTRKRGTKATHEDGVEVLGLVEDHVDD